MIEFPVKFRACLTPLGPDRWISGIALETREDGMILVRSCETGALHWLETWAIKTDVRRI